MHTRFLPEVHDERPAQAFRLCQYSHLEFPVIILRQHGGTVIVQDEASSAVFGMPKSVIQAGLASEVLPLDGMADFVVRHVQPLASGPMGRFSSRIQPVPAR